MTLEEIDPIIAEVRAARHAISARVDHDPRRLVAYYLQKQARHRDRWIGSDASQQAAAEAEPVPGKPVQSQPR